MKQFSIFLQIIFVLFHYSLSGVEAIECTIEPKNNEGRLRKALLCNYDKANRPILTDGAITIKFKMIIKAFNFDDANGKLIVSTWLAMSWTDEHLKWDPKDYNGLSSITQSSDTIWQPDFALYNSDVASSHDEFCKEANCVIASNGLVSCIPPCSHSAKCAPNYARWPYDRQNCTLHIGTWVNSGEEIDFKVLKTIITEDELSSQNLAWRLIRATYKRNPGNFSETKQTYPSLTFSFLMERHSASHSATILVPAFTLFLLNMISLWVESENNRRIILLSLSLYGHFSFIQNLYWAVPSNGDTVPDLLIYFRDSLLMTAILIVNTIVVRGLSSCNVQVPDWVENTTYMNKNRVGQLFLTKHLIDRERFSNENGTTDDDINLVESQPAEKPANTSNQWKTFANIVDRTFFVVFFIIYLIMMISLLPEGFLDAHKAKSVEIIGY